MRFFGSSPIRNSKAHFFHIVHSLLKLFGLNQYVTYHTRTEFWQILILYQRTLAASDCFATPVGWSPDVNRIFIGMLMCRKRKSALDCRYHGADAGEPPQRRPDYRLAVVSTHQKGSGKYLHNLRVSGILSVSRILAPDQRREVRRARRFFSGIRDFSGRPDCRCVQFRSFSSIDALRL